MVNQILVDPDEYVGAVKTNGEWHFFYESLGMWILDYSEYSPDYVPKPGGWREKMLKVDKDNAKEYCEAMKAKEIPVTLIRNTMSKLGGGQMPLTFVVDFDERLFINGWHDNIPIDEYAPNGWRSLEDDPYKYIPPDMRALWNK